MPTYIFILQREIHFAFHGRGISHLVVGLVLKHSRSKTQLSRTVNHSSVIKKTKLINEIAG